MTLVSLLLQTGTAAEAAGAVAETDPIVTAMAGRRPFLAGDRRPPLSLLRRSLLGMGSRPT